MNINELNAKLVSELREIAKLIGIADAEKLRKQELISKIMATENDKPADEDPASTEEEASETKHRKRVRTSVKQAEPVEIRKKPEKELAAANLSNEDSQRNKNTATDTRPQRTERKTPPAAGTSPTTKAE